MTEVTGCWSVAGGAVADVPIDLEGKDLSDPEVLADIAEELENHAPYVGLCYACARELGDGLETQELMSFMIDDIDYEYRDGQWAPVPEWPR